MASATQTIRERLAKLANAPHARSLMRQVAEVLPSIEQALASGVSYAAISESLTRSGVPISAQALKTYLYRLRKAQRAAVSTQPTTATQARAAGRLAAAKKSTRAARGKGK